MKKQLVAFSAAAIAFGAAHAGPADSVHTPDVEFGEREIEFSAGSARDGGHETESAASLSFGVGVTRRWFTEIGVAFERERGESLRYEGFEWENKFQLTESGRYPIDLGLLVELERPRDRDDGWALQLGLLTQKDFGNVRTNLNLLAERRYDSDDDGGTELGYQWQVKYRAAPQFEYGLHGFGGVGEWNDWAKSDEQQHSVGPAIFGALPLGDDDELEYEVGFLFGLSKETPDHTLRVKLEYAL